ncbi:2-hydroxychromene-2-carboxylate isomerase [Pseudorhodoferax sp. Leaf267]|uniref:2-hydroxychromene-2-carboxylate isomerase n=1 Tax=Pseudorhodoferax sp. Leaf267 TaxID=1736316 RepID=UPI0006F5846E|nr:2-hydroxychromene-2-carboxylate isomerase [Pseudorhodoferax sp. Leaf267]KQP13139.1 2-hydroxychromene-2-carboxylate isomerase [Pseudorhodoferax sp. Leaf267]
MPTLEFFFDISSPWTYLAFHNIQPLAQECGATIRWRPFMVGGVFNTVNPTVYESRSKPVPAKQAYLGKSLKDWARWTGVEVNFPPTVFPVNSVKVMRGCLVADAQGQLPAFARAAFEAYWQGDQDIAQDDVVRQICARADMDADALLQAIGEQAIKDALRANTEDLIARGGFGSPTIFVGGGDMYFGNDHLPLVRAALLRP